MDLDITGATFGYNTEGVKTLLERIKNDQLDRASKEMGLKLTTLTTTVDKVWVGKSADTFKLNLQNDITKIQAAIAESYKGVENVLGKSLHDMIYDVDADLVKDRSKE